MTIDITQADREAAASYYESIGMYAFALRARASVTPEGGPLQQILAAHRIASTEELRAENEQLREALESIADRDKVREWTATADNPETHWVVRDGAYAVIARAALASKGGATNDRNT